jgi:hypothetical protein
VTWTDTPVGGIIRRTINGDLIDDTIIISVAADKNYGIYDYLHMANSAYVALVRCATSSIPAGKIVAARYCWPGAGVVVAGTSLGLYRVVPAAAWVEGSAYGAIQAGSCCWNYCQYTALAWAAGHWTTADRVDDPSPPIITAVAATPGNVVLPTAWFEGWRGSTFANNGFSVVGNVSGPVFFQFDGGYALNLCPYFEIDYIPNALPPGFLARRK